MPSRPCSAHGLVSTIACSACMGHEVWYLLSSARWCNWKDLLLPPSYLYAGIFHSIPLGRTFLTSHQFKFRAISQACNSCMAPALDCMAPMLGAAWSEEH